MRISPILVPYDHDIARWGTATGPRTIIQAGLLEHVRSQGHDVAEPIEIGLPREERTRDSVTNLGRIGARLSEVVATAVRGGSFALVLAGNCPHAVGAVGGLARAGSTPGIVWYDAHGDLNTFATTETGFIGGLPFAVALGWDLDDWRLACGLERPVQAEAAALIGANDLDAAEVAALTRHPIARLDAKDLDASGARTREALAPRAAAADAWYLHLDFDVVGPTDVPGATTPSASPADGAAVLASLQAAASTLALKACTLATYHASGDPERRGLPYIFAALDAILAGMVVGQSSSRVVK